MKIPYVKKRFSDERMQLVEWANDIIEDYEEQGYNLTVRQVYYKFIAKDLFPDTWIDEKYNAKHGLPPNAKNTEKNYKKFGVILGDARMAGFISWDSIEDRTRSLKESAHWESPEEIIESAIHSYRIDKWEDQPCRPEIWVEKEALINIVERTATALDVPHFACKGYTSLSSMWRAGRRMMRWRSEGQHPVVIHLGDHDPSGIDMTRDIFDRLETFSENKVEVIRIALNMDQIEQYGPPPNPAKIMDSRSKGYIEDHGTDSWELDALEPAVINALIEKAVKEVRDDFLWDAAVEKEEEGRERLRGMIGEGKS